ncbi:MAG TPA: glutathione S-transferase, partial [Tabrizicola sp.]|nr:glutathione S-transferase [Tabrizicola sp.]
MMYTLHYAPDNASLIIRLVLDGSGLPYQTALVDRAKRQQDSAAYRALNPTGLIPTLETPNGPISETGAILLWLSDTHSLGPAPSDPDRQVFLKWLFFLSNTAHAELRQIFYPRQYVPADAHRAHLEIMSSRMLRHFGLVETAALQHPRLFAAGRPLGVYTTVLTRWARLYPEGGPRWLDMTAFPTLEALARA